MAVLYRRYIVTGRKVLEDVPKLWREKTRLEVIRWYVEQIEAGEMTIDDVLEEWKEPVQAQLDANVSTEEEEA